MAAEIAGADFICLIPATERLADTYSRMGYSKKISLCDAPQKAGDAIISSSLGFIDFATPDSADAPLLTVDFGLMKPLGKCAEQQEFYFSAPMGER